MVYRPIQTHEPGLLRMALMAELNETIEVKEPGRASVWGVLLKVSNFGEPLAISIPNKTIAVAATEMIKGHMGQVIYSAPKAGGMPGLRR